MSKKKGGEKNFNLLIGVDKSVKFDFLFLII